MANYTWNYLPKYYNYSTSANTVGPSQSTLVYSNYYVTPYEYQTQKKKFVPGENCIF